MKVCLIIIALVMFNSCSGGGSAGSGGAPTSPNNSPWSSFAVVAESDLPACEGDILSRLYYIESTDTFKVCKTTGWQNISVGSKITSVNTCIKLQGSTFLYTVTSFSSGHKIINCSISDDLNTYSNSVVYSSNQSGYTTDSCSLVYDLDATSKGFWKFELNGGSRTVTYEDSASASNGSIVSYASSDCVTN